VKGARWPRRGRKMSLNCLRAGPRNPPSVFALISASLTKKSINGDDIWILVVYDFSGNAWSYFVKTKSHMSTIIDDLIHLLKTANHTVKYLLCDDAGENANLIRICAKQNVTIKFSAPYMPQQTALLKVYHDQATCMCCDVCS
jgi:hypothetical protein